MDERTELLRKSWEGEIVGTAFFAGLARRRPDEAGLWDVLARVEAVTAALVDPVARAAGVEVDDVALAAAGDEFAANAAASAHAELLESGLTAIAGYVETYERLAPLLDDADAWLATELVAHEEAVAAVFEAELHGRPDPAARAREYLARHAAPAQ